MHTSEGGLKPPPRIQSKEIESFRAHNAEVIECEVCTRDLKHAPQNLTDLVAMAASFHSKRRGLENTSVDPKCMSARHKWDEKPSFKYSLEVVASLASRASADENSEDKVAQVCVRWSVNSLLGPTSCPEGQVTQCKLSGARPPVNGSDEYLAMCARVVDGCGQLDSVIGSKGVRL